MATTDERRSGNGFLYFAVGALIVAVAVLAWLFYGGDRTTETADSSAAMERSADAISDAADEIGDSVGDAARSVPAPQPPAAPAPAPEPSTPAPESEPAPG